METETASNHIGAWLHDHVAADPNAAAIAEHGEADTTGESGDPWRHVRAGDLVDDVERIASGLIELGVEPGEPVIILAPTSADWTRLDLALMSIGAITVPIYPGSDTDQCQIILERTGARRAFVASDEADELRSIDDDLDVRPIDEVRELRSAGRVDGTAHANRSVDPDQVATIVFTSGTTGDPKGVPLTHRQMLWTADAAAQHLHETLGPRHSTLLFLPLAHIFARAVVLAALHARVEIGYARSIDDVPEDLRSYRPTFLLAVPRMLERVIAGGRAKATGWRRPVFDWSLATARQRSRSGQSGPLATARYRIADRLVLRQLRDGLGGRVEVVVSGGARLDPEIAHVLAGLGISVLEGYGLTETTGPITVGRPGDWRIGTVGTAFPGASVRIDDGEVLVRAPSVTAGYLTSSSTSLDDLERPGDTFDGDWFRTGDQGEIDDDGHLVISGRATDMLVTDVGEKVAPVPLEDALTAHSEISQAMVLGDDRPFVAALVVGDESAADDPEALERTVERAIDEINADAPRHEQIREFRILDRPFEESRGELTPTMKLKREVILDHFSDEVDSMYADAD